MRPNRRRSAPRNCGAATVADHLGCGIAETFGKTRQLAGRTRQHGFNARADVARQDRTDTGRGYRNGDRCAIDQGSGVEVAQFRLVDRIDRNALRPCRIDNSLVEVPVFARGKDQSGVLQMTRLEILGKMLGLEEVNSLLQIRFDNFGNDDDPGVGFPRRRTFAAASLPCPTTSTRRPATFMKAGNTSSRSSGFSVFSECRHHG